MEGGPAPPTTRGWDRTARLAGWAIVVLGTALRLRLWLADRSLWRDEAALVFNLLHRGPTGFTEPLDFDQGAPAGFFVLEVAVSRTLGPSELALRLVPVLASVLALVVALVLARRHLEPAAGLVALALLACSQGLLAYSAEVKQYSLDVLVTLLVWLAASIAAERDLDRGACIVLAATGVAAVVCSHTAVFVLAGAGVVLAWGPLRRRDGPVLVRLAGVGSTWVAAWVTVYLLSLRDLQGDPFLRDFWRDGFLAVPPTSGGDLDRWGAALRSLPDLLGGRNALWVLAPLALLGAAAVARRSPGLLAVLGLPWVAVVGASAVEAYPAVERMVLFLVPALAVLVGEGTARCVAWSRPALGRAAVVPAVLVVAMGATAGLADAADPPGIEELRPLLEQVARRDEPGDAVYVSAVAVPAWDYYRDRLDLVPATEVRGAAPIDDADAIAAELAPLDGHRRVWVVTAAFWRDPGLVAGTITSQLDRLGRPVEAWHGPGASVYLYDLAASPAGGRAPTSTPAACSTTVQRSMSRCTMRGS